MSLRPENPYDAGRFDERAAIVAYLLKEVAGMLGAFPARILYRRANAIERGEHCPAQAIEARRAATGTGAVEDESAVPKGCAQEDSLP